MHLCLDTCVLMCFLYFCIWIFVYLYICVFVFATDEKERVFPNGREHAPQTRSPFCFYPPLKYKELSPSYNIQIIVVWDQPVKSELAFFKRSSITAMEAIMAKMTNLIIAILGEGQNRSQCENFQIKTTFVSIILSPMPRPNIVPRLLKLEFVAINKKLENFIR